MNISPLEGLNYHPSGFVETQAIILEQRRGIEGSQVEDIQSLGSVLEVVHVDLDRLCGLLVPQLKQRERGTCSVRKVEIKESCLMIFFGISDESLELVHQELVILLSKGEIFLEQSLESVSNRDLLGLQE
jgi:hypothetical protein